MNISKQELATMINNARNVYNTDNSKIDFSITLTTNDSTNFEVFYNNDSLLNDTTVTDYDLIVEGGDYAERYPYFMQLPLSSLIECEIDKDEELGDEIVFRYDTGSLRVYIDIMAYGNCLDSITV